MKFHRSLAILSIAAVLVIAAAPALGANSLNARFIRWVDKTNVIHIFAFADEGMPGQPAASVKDGQWVLFGFEWAGESVAELQDYLDTPGLDITVSVDGAAAFSVGYGIQDAFEAVPGSGPRWSWDHDGDGLGDGNGNSVGDWEGPIAFFRYLHSGLAIGTHAFEFTFIEPGFSVSQIITVEVVAGD
jgi:hypothetical protein